MIKPSSTTQLSRCIHSHHLSYFSTKDALSKVVSLLRAFQRGKRSPSHKAHASGTKQDQSNVFRVLKDLKTTDVTSESIVKLQRAILAGFYSNLAFRLQKLRARGGPPRYMLPGNKQFARLSSGSLCKASAEAPDVVVFLEAMDTEHSVYIQKIFGIQATEDIAQLHPERFLSLEVY